MRFVENSPHSTPDVLNTPPLSILFMRFLNSGFCSIEMIKMIFQFSL